MLRDFRTYKPGRIAVSSSQPGETSRSLHSLPNKRMSKNRKTFGCIACCQVRRLALGETGWPLVDCVTLTKTKYKLSLERICDPKIYRAVESCIVYYACSQIKHSSPHWGPRCSSVPREWLDEWQRVNRGTRPSLHASRLTSSKLPRQRPSLM